MTTGAFQRAAGAVRPLDQTAMEEARARQDRLTKPRGALGRLEALSVQLAGIAGACPAPVPAPAAVAVFAADHGVVAEGVTPWPQEVTAQMVANFVSGGAAINVLARAVGASVTVVDVGVAACSAALDLGARVASDLVAGRPPLAGDAVDRPFAARALVTGEMGIGNT